MDEVVAATTALGAHEFITAMPDGYDTDLANSAGRLSAGQRQLVAFARAFLADPAVLILDEATSSLDVPSERLVQRALRTVLAGRTAVIIAHRLSTVEIADRVLVMEHGRIVEDGSPADLIAGSGDGPASPTSTRPGSTRWPDGPCMNPRVPGDPCSVGVLQHPNGARRGRTGLGGVRGKDPGSVRAAGESRRSPDDRSGDRGRRPDIDLRRAPHRRRRCQPRGRRG